MLPEFIVVGASHASRLAEQLEACGSKVTLISMPSWRPTPTTAAKAAGELATAVGSSAAGAVTIFQFLDCAAFYARTEDGGLLPSRRSNDDNKYHLDGELVMAPAELFLHTLKSSLPIFKAAGQGPKLLISPLPRYWLTSCCADADHIPNRTSSGNEEMLFMGLDTIRRQCKDFLHISKIRDCTTLNAAQLICSSEGARITPDAVKAELQKCWGGDPVHPADQCYAALAKNVLTLCEDKRKLAREAPKHGGGDNQPKRARWIENSNDVAPTWWAGDRQRGGAPQHRGRGRGRGTRARRGYGRAWPRW